MIYVIVGAVLTGHGAVQRARRAQPIRWRTRSSVAGLHGVGWIVALGAVVSMTAVLLVFQYGQPRIFFAMARDGLLPQWAAQVHPKYAHAARRRRSSRASFVALGALVGDAGETYDLTNIGTLFAFALVCIGVLVLRYTEPDRPRPFRVPFVWPVTLVGAAACVYRDVRACRDRRGSGSALAARSGSCSTSRTATATRRCAAAPPRRRLAPLIR